jgi:hypothetical protein
MPRYYLGVILIIAYAAAMVVAVESSSRFGPLLVMLAYGATSFALRCPYCGFPLLRRGPVWVPWPSKQCRCGNDLRS